MICPMCLSKGSMLQPVQGPDKREYSLCFSCKLIFTSTRFQLTAVEQKKRYEKHRNGLQNTGYVKFLNRAIEPALSYLHTGMKGLDYGCGPVPTLSRLLDLRTSVARTTILYSFLVNYSQAMISSLPRNALSTSSSRQKKSGVFSIC